MMSSKPATALAVLLLTTVSIADGRPVTAEHPLAVSTGAVSGDRFHVLYVTDATTDATSPDIATYQAVVQQDAESQGLGGVTWHAMVATANQPLGPVNAPQTARVVLVDGTPFREPGALYTPAGQPGSPAVLDGGGELVDPGGRVWTGINAFGDGGVTNPSAGALGLANCYAGAPIEATNNTWWLANILPNTAVFPVFGLSEELTVGDPAEIQKGKLTISRRKPSADSLTIRGTLPETLALLPATEIVGDVTVGGLRRQFTLTAKGRSLKDPAVKVRIDQGRRTFQVQVRKSDLAAALDLPDADNPKPGTPVEVTWQVTFEGTWSIFGTSTFSYVSKQGKSGTGKLVR